MPRAPCRALAVFLVGVALAAGDTASAQDGEAQEPPVVISGSGGGGGGGGGYDGYGDIDWDGPDVVPSGPLFVEPVDVNSTIDLFQMTVRGLASSVPKRPLTWDEAMLHIRDLIAPQETDYLGVLTKTVYRSCSGELMYCGDRFELDLLTTDEQQKVGPPADKVFDLSSNPPPPPPPSPAPPS